MSWIWWLSAVLAVGFVLSLVAARLLDWWRATCYRLARRWAES